MEDRVKHYENEPLNQVYSNHSGREITPFTNKLSVDSDVIIFSTSSLDLIDNYIHENKRNYILLDKDIDRKQIRKKHVNSWYIPTDLKLPSLVLVDNAIIHLPFNLTKKDNQTYNEIRSFYIYLIQTYVKKMSDIVLEYDIIHPNITKKRTYPSVQELAREGILMISDLFTIPDLVTTTFRSELNQDYIKLESQHSNPIDIVRKNKLNCGIYYNGEVIELLTEFEFELSNMSYKSVKKQITYKDAFNNAYYKFDGSLVAVESNLNETITIKLDYRQSINQSYVDNEINKLIESTKPKIPCLKQTFKILITQMKLSDFENLKKLTKDEVSKEVEEPELIEAIYKSSKGLVAVVNNPTEDLLKYKNLKYIISKQNE